MKRAFQMKPNPDASDLKTLGIGMKSEIEIIEENIFGKLFKIPKKQLKLD